MLRRLYDFAKFLKSLSGTNFRLLHGMWHLTKLPLPAITMFGSARLPFKSKHSERACALAKMLALDGFSIITGGGPGIMEAANRGAYEAAQELGIKDKKKYLKKTSAGIGLTRLNLEKFNPYLHESIIMEHFFARKWLLVRNSMGFIVFPGGFGTLDELFEVVTLIQCDRMKKVPIVLMGKTHWDPIYKWASTMLVKEGFVSKKDLSIIATITDDVDEAYKIIKRNCQRYKS